MILSARLSVTFQIIKTTKPIILPNNTTELEQTQEAVVVA